MAHYSLIPHPDRGPRDVNSVSVEIDADADEATLTFVIAGERFVKIPALQSPLRADNLWQTTCFELFLKPAGGTGYVEFNFSPSGQWAAYDFDDVRANMRALPLSNPPHVSREEEGWMVDVDFSEIPPVECSIGVTAVIEETDGTKSYWALAHAPGPPDFHNPDCFIATLPAPDAT